MTKLKTATKQELTAEESALLVLIHQHAQTAEKMVQKQVLTAAATVVLVEIIVIMALKIQKRKELTAEDHAQHALDLHAMTKLKTATKQE